MDKKENIDIINKSIKVLPLRQVVIFPDSIVTLEVGRKSSKLAVEQVGINGILAVCTQKNIDTEEPTLEDIFEYGILVEVIEIKPNVNNSIRVSVKGLDRIKIDALKFSDSIMIADYSMIKFIDDDSDESYYTNIAYARKLISQLRLYNQLVGGLPKEYVDITEDLYELINKIDFIANVIIKSLHERYEFFTNNSLNEKIEYLIIFLDKECTIASLEIDINNKLKLSLDKSQRDYYLREKIKVINEELGEATNKESEIAQFREQILKLNLPSNIRKRLNKEVDRLSRLNSISPDYGNLISYLDFALSLPWEINNELNIDLSYAEQTLDKDHFGLKKVKERILEFLATYILSGKELGSIICLVGPPGVGKTSLAKSIAKATGRAYVRLSLGGIHDESEIRGHRRTYVGALPGRILSGLSVAESLNPVFLLDEIDKISSDFRGNPSAALLEVLDPEQNSTFSDHYLEMPFDLSNVFFITTANSIQTIPGALRDRMEIIEVPSYTELEKIEIAQTYLIKKQLESHGLTNENVAFTKEAIVKIISEYTSEAGVRELERQIGSICRKIARRVVSNDFVYSIVVTDQHVNEFLGIEHRTHQSINNNNRIGVAIGVAWTAVGGEILQIECQAMRGEGQLILTGMLGDVMKESATIALSLIRSMETYFQLDVEAVKKLDFHIHVPTGAVPKDGPSAGVPLTVALASVISKKEVQCDIAMTGEVTLQGKILPVGGIREKVLAAVRAGCKQIILPADNEKDIVDVNAEIKNDIEFLFYEHIEQVLNYVLVRR